MTALVAGVGYIGAALAAALLRAGERVVGLDNGFATDVAAVYELAALGDFRLVEASTTSARGVARAFVNGPFDVLYVLAAQASAAVAARRPRYTEMANLTGPRVLLAAAARAGVPRVVYVSSMRVYGDVLPPYVDEHTAYGPQRDLAHLSHIYGEKLLELYARQSGCTAVAVRLAVVYGVGPVMKRDYRFLTVPNRYCLQAARGEALAVFAGGATPTGFVHLDDACAALRLAATAEWPEPWQVANAAAEVCTVPAVAEAVVAAGAERGLAVQVRGRPEGTLPSTPAVISRLTPLGWHPGRELAQSVGPILDYYLAREAAS